MKLDTLVIADPVCYARFRELGNRRDLFRDASVEAGADGRSWLVDRTGDHAFAICSHGPAWIFETPPEWREARLEFAAEAEAATDRDSFLRDRARLVRVGKLAERLLWTIHAMAIAQKSKQIRVPHRLLARFLWGHRRPAHWRQELRTILRGLGWLHVGPVDWEADCFGSETSLLVDYQEPPDGEDMPASSDNDVRESKRRREHDYFAIEISAAFLGQLRCALPAWTTRNEKAALRALREAGRGGGLRYVYLPSLLGDPVKCGAFSRRQHGLLQTLIREETRPKRQRPIHKYPRSKPADGQIGNSIPSFSGQGEERCPLLDDGASYVGFNGNGHRPGSGYKLTTWLERSGYKPEEPQELKQFLSDLACLVESLKLIPVGLFGFPAEWFDLDRMIAMCKFADDRQKLRAIHLRVYAPPGYREAWNQLFGWNASQSVSRSDAKQENALLKLKMMVADSGLRAVAKKLGVNRSFVFRIVNGEKRLPQGRVDQVLSMKVRRSQGR